MISLPSPAKINRFLHIIGKREDGYHLLQTAFQFLDYGDTLHFECLPHSRIEITPHTMVGVSMEDNLIYRAALALQKAANVKSGIKIHIEKQLPLGAGLGGGSSNAATTLLALNLVWQLNWSLEQLIQLGVTLGADIPIFLFGQSAWGEGIGEQLTPIELDEPWILVITPPCHVNTAKMFADPDLTRNAPRLRIGALDLSQTGNDFEALARRRYPEVDAAMKWLSNYSKARLSGSGASVFACFETQKQAKETLTLLHKPFTGFIAKAANISPLQTALRKYITQM